jgi:hypothetical protein
VWARIFERDGKEKLGRECRCRRPDLYPTIQDRMCDLETVEALQPVRDFILHLLRSSSLRQVRPQIPFTVLPGSLLMRNGCSFGSNQHKPRKRMI